VLLPSCNDHNVREVYNKELHGYDFNDETEIKDYIFAENLFIWPTCNCS